MDIITVIGRINKRITKDENGVESDDFYPVSGVAREILTTFGEGGNPDAPIPEEFLGFVNTPMTKDGYIRCSVKQSFGVALDYIKSIGGANAIELIEVEHEGQKMYQVGVDADGNPEWLGMINGLPAYVNPTEDTI